MGKIVDITGQTFGRWTVLEYVGKSLWLCKCSCGAKKCVVGFKLRIGSSRSCGCLRRELTSTRFKTHGYSDSSEYNSWVQMRNRCYNRNAKRYPDWGGRGITVCDRWRDSFENFYEDMGDKPTPEHSIDRIDNDDSYCPENCQWSTVKEQNANKRKYKLRENV